MRAGTFCLLLFFLFPNLLRGDDLDQIRQRGRIRVLVSPSRTNFFIARGQLHGFSYDFLSDYGREFHEMTVDFIPLAEDELIPALLDGRGDIAAAVTISPELPPRVAFTEPYLSDIDEIIVASKSAREIHSLNDLSDRKLTVVKGSSAAAHLSQSQLRFVEAPDALAPEDLLEMVNAGLIEFTVAKTNVAQAWAQVLPNLVLRRELVVHRGDKNALAVRPDSPKLLASLNEFVRAHRKHTLVGNELFRRYFENTRWLENPLNDDPLKSLRGLEASFRKYGAQTGFDWLFLAAQGFQESGLRQDARSSVGAEGIMQLRPSTARDMGFEGIATTEENIHAGAKYMAWLRDNYFDERQLAPETRQHFTLAAYNAGLGNVKRWREIARSRGKDPDKWLGSVELISLEEVGEQTYRYVRNIDKYYAAYTDWSRELADRAANVKSLEQHDAAR